MADFVHSSRRAQVPKPRQDGRDFYRDQRRRSDVYRPSNDDARLHQRVDRPEVARQPSNAKPSNAEADLENGLKGRSRMGTDQLRSGNQGTFAFEGSAAASAVNVRSLNPAISTAILSSSPFNVDREPTVSNDQQPTTDPRRRSQLAQTTMMPSNDQPDFMKTSTSQGEVLKNALILFAEKAVENSLNSHQAAQLAKELKDIQTQHNAMAKGSKVYAPVLEQLRDKLQSAQKNVDVVAQETPKLKEQTEDQASEFVRKLLALQECLVRSPPCGNESSAVGLPEVVKTVQSTRSDGAEPNTMLLSEVISTLQNTAQENESKVKSVESQVKTLEDQVKTMESQVNTVEVQMKSVESQASTVQGQMNTSQGQVDTLEGQMNTVQGQVGAVQGRVNAVEGQVRTAEDQVNAVEGQMNSLQAQVQIMAAQTNTTNSVLDQLRMENVELKKQIEDLRRTSVSKADMNTIQAEIESLRREQATRAKPTDIANLRQVCDANAHSIQSLVARYNNISTDQFARQMARTLHPVIATFQAENTALNQKVLELQAKLANQDGALQQVTKDLTKREQFCESIPVNENGLPKFPKDIEDLQHFAKDFGKRQELVLQIITDHQIDLQKMPSEDDLSRWIGVKLDAIITTKTEELQKSLADTQSTVTDQSSRLTIAEERLEVQSTSVAQVREDLKQKETDKWYNNLARKSVDAEVQEMLKADVDELKGQVKGCLDGLGQLELALNKNLNNLETIDKAHGVRLNKLEAAVGKDIDQAQRVRLSEPPAAVEAGNERKRKLTMFQKPISNPSKLSSQALVKALLIPNNGDGASMASASQTQVSRPSSSASYFALPTAKNVEKSSAKRPHEPDSDLDNATCGVPLPSGRRCGRKLSCKTHNKIEKQAVPRNGQDFEELWRVHVLEEESAIAKASSYPTASTTPQVRRHGIISNKSASKTRAVPVEVSDSDDSNRDIGLRQSRPPPLVVEGEERYVIDRILEKGLRQKHGDRLQRPHYLVRWEGYDSDEDEWIEASELRSQVPDLVDKYESLLAKEPGSKRAKVS